MRSRQKLEKEIFKTEKIILKRSSLNSDSSTCSLNELKLSYKNQFETIDSDHMSALTRLQERQAKDVQNIYFEMFKQIKFVQISSLEPVWMTVEV